MEGGERKREERGRTLILMVVGTDVDDALALLMLLHLPKEDYELLGITTVYGYTELRYYYLLLLVIIQTCCNRAAIARSILEAHNNNVVPPVIAGRSVPFGTHRSVWHTETEGALLFELDQIDKLKASQLPALEQHKQQPQLQPKKTKEKEKQQIQSEGHEAGRFIADTIMKYPNEVVQQLVLAILI